MAKLFFKRFHPEPYEDRVKEWKFESTGAMSGANQALSYILLKRDRKKFEKEYPTLVIEYDKPFNGLSYVLTGGLWLHQFLPDCLISFLHRVEKKWPGLMRFWGLHHVFVIKKID